MKTRRRVRVPSKKLRKGGSVESVVNLISSTDIVPTFVNEASKFVVATYWWGRENINRNLQRPCPEDIIDPIREQILEEFLEDDPDQNAIYVRVGALARERRSRELTPEEAEEYRTKSTSMLTYEKEVFARDNAKRMVNERYAAKVAELTAAGQFRPGTTFAEMIRHWEETMRAANCNYVATNTEFPREDYQNGINGKPVFIKKVLDSLRAMGKNDVGVLYIDGDMDIHKYPALFDLPNVDFMARGWNIDPRDNAKYTNEEYVYFNPYIFETSGGTMYFGNTDSARTLLDLWIDISADPQQKGKADDRLISMVVTEKLLNIGTNIVQLPIEYLWLTDKYAGRPETDAKKADSFIEHPACLTGEERAAEQGAAANRQPVGYTRLEDALDANPKVSGGVLYESVFFGKPEVAEGLRPWLNYVSRTNRFTVVPFSQRYGEYTAIADENTRRATEMGDIALAPTKDPAQILSYLMRGMTVTVNGRASVFNVVSPEIEFAAVNLGTLGTEEDYQPVVTLDVTKPMMIRPGNPVVLDLIRMCRTLEDLNVHVQNNYMFLSRIRWKLVPLKALAQRAR